MSSFESIPESGGDAAWREFWDAQLASHLAALFGSADPTALAELQADAEWVSLRGGEVLFRRGDPGNAAYTVLCGRVRVVDDSAGELALNEIGAGEIVGEMALLSAERRSATVLAVRDSLLARLPAAAFHRLIEREPAVLRRISALLSARLRSQSTSARRQRALVRTLAVVPTGPSPGAAAFARRLAEALARLGSTLHLDAGRVDQALGREGIARCAEHDHASARLVQWLNEQELAHRFVLYEADAHLNSWTERAVRQADHVVFVADSTATSEPDEIEQGLAARWRAGRAPRRSVVFVSDGAGRSGDTVGFLRAREVDCHYHVAMDRAADFARLARCLTGAGIGLVLGGGGARGFAHLGVLRALAEAGIPIDWVGGTSVGGIIAALVAQRLSPDESLAQCKEHFSSLKDPTLPVVALLAGRRIRSKLERVFGTQAIEDLPLPYLCVSTNLSRAAQSVHERGPLVRAIRASIALPGVLPPVSMGGDLHVDGGLVNNVPIDVMAGKPEIGTVIAVDVSAEVEMRAPSDFALETSGWRILWDRLHPGAARSGIPSIMSLLARSALVASVYWNRERRTAETASLYLRIPMADLRLLAFDRIDEIVARGYEAAGDAIRAWANGRPS
ncbi:MAG: patatin-like phospholipase family protein [Betaproteobacteria bacterium]|nr:patatin-like phospholipase family protein [Betaproteobacteria bacterium]